MRWLRWRLATLTVVTIALATAAACVGDPKEVEIVNNTEAVVEVRISVVQRSGEWFRQAIRLEPGKSYRHTFGISDDPERWVALDESGEVLLSVSLGWERIRDLDGPILIDRRLNR